MLFWFPSCSRSTVGTLFFTSRQGMFPPPPLLFFSPFFFKINKKQTQQRVEHSCPNANEIETEQCWSCSSWPDATTSTGEVLFSYHSLVLYRASWTWEVGPLSLAWAWVDTSRLVPPRSRGRLFSSFEQAASELKTLNQHHLLYTITADSSSLFLFRNINFFKSRLQRHRTSIVHPFSGEICMGSTTLLRYVNLQRLTASRHRTEWNGFNVF